MMAQRYPGLLDGILAVAPAIGATSVAMGSFWPQVLMIESGTFLSNCEFGWFTKKAIEKCDLLDGVRDGVITDPEACDFDPSAFVGEKFHCDGQEIQVTQTMAEIVRKTWEGPKTAFGTSIYPGLPHGASAEGIADINISPEGVRSPNPFAVASAYVKSLLLKDPSFNISKLTYESYFALWAQAEHQYAWLLDTDSTDLSGLKNAGTKLLSWHGINDEIISYENTIHYRQRVEIEMGGAKSVDEYYRLFLAPGVKHCRGGLGPAPHRAMEQLEDWVEKGEAPETLDARTTNTEGDLVTRELCKWPRKLKYMGIGDANRASSWTCEGEETFEDFSSENTNRAGEILGGLKERLIGLGLGLNIN